MSLDLLSGLLAPYQGGGAPMETTSPLLSLALQAVMQPQPAPPAPQGRGGMGESPQGPGTVGPAHPGTAESLAERAAREAGVPVSWAHDPKFWYQTEHESGLYPTGTWQDIVKSAHADNPTSTAYGIGQFLQATRDAYNLPLHAGPMQQMEAMFQYIRDRYGNPQGAYDYRMQHGFY